MFSAEQFCGQAVFVSAGLVVFVVVFATGVGWSVSEGAQQNGDEEQERERARGGVIAEQRTRVPAM